MNRLQLVVCFICAAIVSLTAVTRPARAEIEFTPFVGLLHPTESDVQDLTSGAIVFQTVAGPAFGARVTWWMNRRFGLEGSAMGNSTQFRLAAFGAEIVQFDLSATRVIADGKLRFRLNPGTGSPQFDVIAGFDYSHLWSTFDDILGSVVARKGRVGGVVGLGTTLELFSNAALRVDVEDHIHNTHLEIDAAALGIPGGDRQQHDLLFTVGVTVPLSSR